jgi:flagellar biosynthesis GTPase FlhF
MPAAETQPQLPVLPQGTFAVQQETVDFNEEEFLTQEEVAGTEESPGAEEALTTDDETAAAEAEQRRYEELKKKQDQEEANRIRIRLEEARRKAEEEKQKKQKEEEKKRKKRRGSSEEDEEEAREWRQTWFRRGLAAACVLVLCYYAWEYGSFLLPRGNPFPQLSAEKLLAQYSEDSKAADQRWANKRIIVTGKLVVVSKPRSRTPPRIFFEGPSEKGDMSIECIFPVPADEIGGIRQGTAYRVAGEVQPFKVNSTLELKDAVLLGPAEPSGGKANARSRKFAHLARATAAKEASGERLHQIPTHSSLAARFDLIKTDKRFTLCCSLSPEVPLRKEHL